MYCCQIYGHFRYCFNRAYQCPSTNCDLPMMEHSRRMVHRNVCVEITTQNYVHLSGDFSSAVVDERNAQEKYKYDKSDVIHVGSNSLTMSHHQ
ncbi:Uncharacterized protein BM_BM400 [Brugia malayi]|nr:Uncharacterized protein BM_BM400 [Brugia malayi]CDP94461.1 Bm400 [Brugia malayi]VIO88968.1 Uncharacterized protein BM_BM400 [Brugia malayi]